MRDQLMEQERASFLKYVILAYQEAEILAVAGKATAVLMRSRMFLRIHWKNIQTLAKMRRS